jgi:polysaccharide deacetylase family protein (PEP-CTERM system associated)
MSPVLNAFTVDLEDWYQGLEIGPETWGSFADRLRVGSDRLLRLLDAASVQATFFVLGYAAERDPDLIREIQDRGHEIGTHGYAHRLVYQLDSEEFKRDIERSLETLSAIVSGPIRTHRAPFFSITKQSEWAFDVLAECGIECDSSVFPVQNYRYGIADAPRWQYQVRPGLTEFPLSTYRLNGRNIPVGGGAYFRIFPYTLTRYALRAINDEGGAAVFYIHPWELDPEHPRLDLPRRISLTHYWNLAATERRLERLLDDFHFASLGRVLGHGSGSR